MSGRKVLSGFRMERTCENVEVEIEVADLKTDFFQNTLEEV